MPTTIRRLTANGLQPVGYTADSLAQAATYEPDDGVYTVANTVNTYGVVKLTAHLDRLQDSAQRAAIPFTVDRAALRAGLRDLIRLSGYADVRFRITVPRQSPDEPILTVEPFGGHPDALYERGVRVATAPDSARHNAAAKDTAWIRQREALRQKTDAYEVILMGADGHLLEGTTSNFYAILRDTLYTASDGVLGGISREVVFTVAPDVLPLVRRPVHQRDIPALQEAFISSSSRGIVPVVQVDDHHLGDGVPGPYTRQLMAAYRAWGAAHTETL